MSTHHDIICSCGARAELSGLLSVSGEALRLLVEHRAALTQIAALQQMLRNLDDSTGSIAGCLELAIYGQDVPLDFFAEHAGPRHALRVVSEYEVG